MKKELPVLLVLITGMIMIIQYFIPSQASENFFQGVQEFLKIMGMPGILLGIASISMVHWHKIRRKAPGYLYSVVVFIGMFFSIVLGFWKGTQAGTPYQWILNNIQIPITSTMFSLLAFYIASAAYRAFRARSPEATVLLLAAFIVMIGRVSIWTYLPESIGHWFPDITEWLMNVPNMAAKRGVMLGVGLGSMAMSVKILLGIERKYLG